MFLKNTFKLVVLFFLLSCGGESNNEILVINSGKTQGTFYHIKYLIEDAKNLQNQIDSVLLCVDNSLSTYNSSSLISKINKGEEVIVDPLFQTVFNTADTVYKKTEGAFDCSIAPLVNSWGFGFSNREKMDTLKVNQLLQNIGYNKISLKNDSIFLPSKMLLDFNSIAQGYTVDLIANLFDLNGLNHYLIEIGGEIRAKGLNADSEIWKIGVDKPSEKINSQDRFQFILELDNKSLATSGNYRKFYIEDGVRYSHVISPFNGFPAKNKLLSVTVIHDECIYADAYATAFMVMGLKNSKILLEENDDLEAYFIFSKDDGELGKYVSKSFNKRILN